MDQGRSTESKEVTLSDMSNFNPREYYFNRLCRGLPDNASYKINIRNGLQFLRVSPNFDLQMIYICEEPRIYQNKHFDPNTKGA